MAISYTQPNKTERLIAAGRMVLAAFAIFTISLDNSRLPEHTVVIDSLLGLYLVYSIVLAMTVSRKDLVWARSPVIIHAFDLVFFAFFLFLTGGAASPFFAFFLFALVTSALRWHWRGIICTTAYILGIEIGLILNTIGLPMPPAFNARQFIFNISTLLVVAVMLGSLRTYELRYRDRISSLAEWPRAIPDGVETLVNAILKHVAGLFNCPRTILLWKEMEKDDPSLHVASWSSGHFEYSVESPDTFGSLVAEPLVDEHFLCRDAAQAPRPSVLYSRGAGVGQWEGMPLHPDLQRRFAIESVLSMAVRSESAWGRLFILDKSDISSDDLMPGRVVATGAAFSLDQFYLLKQLRKRIALDAAVEERIRLARDLHDGVLQSLTGVTLQLDVVQKLMDKELQAAQKRLADVQKLVSSEQQNLRSHIKQLKPPYRSMPEEEVDLAPRLMDLAERIERQWGLHVEIVIGLHEHERLPWEIAQGVYFIIHEAIVNAARHARASSVRVEISSASRQLQIAVTDDGCGFPFTGRHDHSDLVENNLGPVILRERVTLLAGRLVVESGATGAHLEITLPIPGELH